jgi:superfamily II DNA or RNA helicase
MNRTSSIVDNRGENKLVKALLELSVTGTSISIASAYFSLDAFNLLESPLRNLKSVRLLFGDEASAKSRLFLIQAFRSRSEIDLQARREEDPFLSRLKAVEDLIEQKKLQVRCYKRDKFHAKAYLIERTVSPEKVGLIGSGNFTRLGLTQNIELNVELSREQAAHLSVWFEERWLEAELDDVTAEILKEALRHTRLYEPFLIYSKALKLWGDETQGAHPQEGNSDIVPILDPHQYEGFRRALQILERHEGVMVCDGVGLGKSFIALAVMESLARGDERGNLDNILLIAPKNILKSTWERYLKKYLRRYLAPFGTIHAIAMTELGFEPYLEGSDNVSQSLKDKQELVRELFERSNVVVVDESHNFRTTSANRYKNLLRIVERFDGRAKKVVLLTATPINTAYQDISAQLALITQESGLLVGYSIGQIRRYAKDLDGGRYGDNSDEGQMSLELFKSPSESLNDILENVVIQRSRQTCRRLAAAVGKDLRFPNRKQPQCIEVNLSNNAGGFAELIETADKTFRPGVHLIELMRKELERVEKAGLKNREAHLTSVLDKLQRKTKGLKLAAFLTEQYRRPGSAGVTKTYQLEVHLAKLVFANALKQLESSPAAFQGIIQSLGTGLIARLRHVFGEKANDLIQGHIQWVRTPLFKQEAEVADEEDSDPEAETADPASDDEVDAWLDHVVRSRGLRQKLAEFNDSDFFTERWLDDIVADLGYLKLIHDKTLEARRQEDPKVEQIGKLIDEKTHNGRKMLVFTQSQRTAEYLQIELSKRLAGRNVARIDSRVAGTRASILHAFCPSYNDRPEHWAPSVPDRIDVLISTDVLAEGVNLQEAHAVLNYDIHWNPVRLIQRIGRVDRRLDPFKTPHIHEIEIFNVLPPKLIEKIINLVGIVENRTLAISKTVGLDLSFFKPTDPAGNLREFNSDNEKWDALYEGAVTSFDQALEDYVKLTSHSNNALLERIADIPEGAFGVWTNAPKNGFFACYVMTAKAEATDDDRKRFKELIGRPVLGILWADGKVDLDSPRVLNFLRDTVPGEISGEPMAEEYVKSSLKTIKTQIRQQFSEVGGNGLPATIVPMLSCMMELRVKN